MAILAFQKPDKVVMLEANDRFGKFEAMLSIPSRLLVLSMSSLLYPV